VQQHEERSEIPEAPACGLGGRPTPPVNATDHKISPPISQNNLTPGRPALEPVQSAKDRARRQRLRDSFPKQRGDGVYSHFFHLKNKYGNTADNRISNKPIG
jgi:hypothetical protein